MGCPVWTSMTTWNGCCAITASASGAVWDSSQAGSSASATWAARRSLRPSTATFARRRTTSTSTASVRLEPEAFRRPFLDAALHVVDGVRQVSEAHQVGVLDDGDDEAVGQRDGDTHVHVMLQDDGFVGPGRVEVGILHQRATNDLNEERHIGQGKAMGRFERLLVSRPVLDQSS